MARRARDRKFYISWLVEIKSSFVNFPWFMQFLSDLRTQNSHKNLKISNSTPFLSFLYLECFHENSITRAKKKNFFCLMSDKNCGRKFSLLSLHYFLSSDSWFNKGSGFCGLIVMSINLRELKTLSYQPFSSWNLAVWAKFNFSGYLIVWILNCYHFCSLTLHLDNTTFASIFSIFPCLWMENFHIFFL